MGKFTCKDPNGEPTRKQTFAIFCMIGKDIREIDLTRQEVSNMISELKSKGKAKLNGEYICLKAKKEKVKWVQKMKSGKTTAAYDWATTLVAKAEEAGKKAMQGLIDSNEVEPMVVQQHANVADDNSPVAKQWVVKGGPCGFASIRVKCTNGPSRKFINQLKKVGVAGARNSHCDWVKSDYYGGYMKSFTMIGGQSMAYKEAYAYAYSEVLSKAGIDTWVWTRMD